MLTDAALFVAICGGPWRGHAASLLPCVRPDTLCFFFKHLPGDATVQVRSAQPVMGARTCSCSVYCTTMIKATRYDMPLQSRLLHMQICLQHKSGCMHVKGC